MDNNYAKIRWLSGRIGRLGMNFTKFSLDGDGYKERGEIPNWVWVRYDLTTSIPEHDSLYIYIYIYIYINRVRMMNNMMYELG